MKLSELSSFRQLDLAVSIAKAIAKIDGYNFDSVDDFAAYAQINPRANSYLLKGEAALLAAKDFGVS